MYKKLEYFAASLTDDEIYAQLKDIFDWARVYKELFLLRSRMEGKCKVLR